MINNLKKFVDNLEVSKSNVGMHVYFDPDTGKINKITSKEESAPNLHSIYVNYEDVKDIQRGIRRFDDFLVTYDPTKNRLVITDQLEKTKIPNIRDRLYNIPQNVPEADVNICCYRDEWTVYLNEEKRIQYYEAHKNLSLDLDMFFSITDKNDPNVLHQTVRLNYRSLLTENEVNISNQIKSTINPNNISVYTARYFDTYNYEVRL